MTPTAVLAEALPPLVTRRHLRSLGVTEADVDRIWRTVHGIERPAGSRNTYATRDQVLAAWEQVRRA